MDYNKLSKEELVTILEKNSDQVVVPKFKLGDTVFYPVVKCVDTEVFEAYGFKPEKRIYDIETMVEGVIKDITIKRGTATQPADVYYSIEYTYYNDKRTMRVSEDCIYSSKGEATIEGKKYAANENKRDLISIYESMAYKLFEDGKLPIGDCPEAQEAFINHARAKMSTALKFHDEWCREIVSKYNTITESYKHSGEACYQRADFVADLGELRYKVVRLEEHIAKINAVLDVYSLKDINQDDDRLEGKLTLPVWVGNVKKAINEHLDALKFN